MQSTLTLPLAALLAALSAGCTNPLRDDGLHPEFGSIAERDPDEEVELPETYVQPGPDEDQNVPPWGIRGGAHEFRLLEERTIDGRPLPKGARLVGLELGGSWLRLPQFEAAEYWRSDFAFVRRHGAATLSRLDFVTDEEEPTPFTTVVHEYLKPVYATGPDAYDPALLCVGILDKDGRTLAVRGRATGVTSLSHEAWVIHHKTVTGLPYDVLHDAKGTPISPPLQPLVRFGETFAVKIEPDRELYWPIQEDGEIFPKPADLLGLQPVYRPPPNETTWTGWWVARWRTARGERLALGKSWNSEGGISMSRDQAIYLDVATGEYHDDQQNFTVSAWIVRREEALGHEIVEEGRPQLARTFASVEDARSFLPSLNTIREEERIAVYGVERLKREKEEAARLKASQAAIEDLLARGEHSRACALATRNYDTFGLIRAVVSTIRAGKGSQLSYDELWSARSCADDENRTWIDREYDVREEAEAAAERASRPQVEQSLVDYFWNGPRNGSGSTWNGQAMDDPTQRLTDHLESVRRQNQAAWLSGAQSWGADSGR